MSIFCNVQNEESWANWKRKQCVHWSDKLLKIPLITKTKLVLACIIEKTSKFLARYKDDLNFCHFILNFLCVWIYAT